MVSTDAIKELRALTFAPLKDCKQALEEANGDIQEAQNILKEQGILKAAKKADRETNEWTICVLQSWETTCIVKLLCETDFVAKNETFLSLAHAICTLIVWNSIDVDQYDALDIDIQTSIAKILTDNAMTIWENMQVAQVLRSSKLCYAYTHPWSKIASVVFYNWSEWVAKDIALQIAAMNPTYLSLEYVPAAVSDALKTDAMLEFADSNKPADMIEKIIAWKILKQLSDDVLLEQDSIKENWKKIKDVLQWTTIESYVRFSIK